MYTAVEEMNIETILAVMNNNEEVVERGGGNSSVDGDLRRVSLYGRQG